MYDTFKGRLDYIDGLEPQRLENKLTNVKVISSNTGNVVTGNIQGLKVTISDHCIYINGSLAKYYFNGENQSTLTRQATRQAIESLSDELSLNIKNASVYQIDVAANIWLQEKEKLYYPLLGNARHYTRLQQPNSLYYNNTLRQLVFYSKVIEQKAKNTPINAAFTSSNLMRYELRLKGKLGKQMNAADIRASSLYDPDFYHSLIKRWQSEYKAIDRQKNCNINKLPNKETMTNSKNFQKYLMQIGIEALGGQNEVLQLVDNAKDLNYFTNKMQPGRLKDAIADVTKFNAGISGKNDLIQELDKRINEVARLHL